MILFILRGIRKSRCSRYNHKYHISCTKYSLKVWPVFAAPSSRWNTLGWMVGNKLLNFALMLMSISTAMNANLCARVDPSLLLRDKLVIWEGTIISTLKLWEKSVLGLMALVFDFMDSSRHPSLDSHTNFPACSVDSIQYTRMFQIRTDSFDQVNSTGLVVIDGQSSCVGYSYFGGPTGELNWLRKIHVPVD